MFKASIINFTQNLHGLRSFLTLVDAFLATHEKGVRESKGRQLAPLVLAVVRLSPEIFKDMPISEEELKERYGRNISVSEVAETEEGGKSVSLDISDEESEQMIKAIREVIATVKSKKILYEGALMTLISSVEWFISQLIKFYYQKFPNALGGKDKFFSLDELKGFGSIKDAQDYLVDSKVEDLLRKSFSDWIKFIKENLGISMGYLQNSEKLLVETFQRRHLLVHNGGIINSTYQSKVDDSLIKGLKVGGRLEIDIDYLMNRIDLFELNCLLIGLEAWKKLNASDKERAQIILQIVEDHITDERWSIAEGLSYFLTNDKQMGGREQVKAKLNYWLSIKNQGRWSDIQGEVASADFSDKDKALQLAYHAILEENDKFFRLLEDAIKGGDISCKKIENHPMFKGVRDDSRYKSIEEKYSDKLNGTKPKKLIRSAHKPTSNKKNPVEVEGGKGKSKKS